MSERNEDQGSLADAPPARDDLPGCSARRLAELEAALKPFSRLKFDGWPSDARVGVIPNAARDSLAAARGLLCVSDFRAARAALAADQHASASHAGGVSASERASTDPVATITAEPKG